MYSLLEIDIRPLIVRNQAIECMLTVNMIYGIVQPVAIFDFLTQKDTYIHSDSSNM